MKIAINWFEVTLSTTELAVPAQTLATAEQGTQSSPESPRHSHRVLQRRGHTAIRLLHITNSPPSDTCLDMVRSADDPDFVKAVIEEGFAQRLVERGFTVRRKHVGRTAYLPTDESLWSDIYTFMRGLEFRGFYFMGATGLRWGIVLNYATSQRFSLSLADPTLRAMALGRRVVRMAASHEAGGTAQVRSGLLVSVEQDAAHVDFGDGESVKAPLNEWTLICRRELLQEYVHQARGQKAAAELIRRMQQASFCLTDSGRMNTSLAKSQVQAIQHLLRQHDLTTFRLPLPGDPPASLSRQPLTISE